MSRFLRVLSVCLAFLLFPCVAFAIDRSACKQYGGAQDCWMPTIADWRYENCGENGSQAYEIAVCLTQGGSWVGPGNCQGLPPVEYKRPTSEDDISQFAEDIYATYYGLLCEGPSAAGWSWGGVFTSINCTSGSGASLNPQGYEIGNSTTPFAVTGKRVQGGVCNTTDTVITFTGRRLRSVGCGSAMGQGQHFSFTTGATPALCSLGTRQPINPKQDCAGCGGSVLVANPIDPNTGSKRQVELDYAGSGPQPLRFERVYNSRIYALDGRQWRHNYSAHIENQEFGTRPVAIVYRPSGRTFLFALTGSDYVADTDIDDRLTRLTGGGGALTGWTYYEASSDSTETYDAEGKLLSIVNRAGLAHTLEYSTWATPPATAPGPGYLLRVTDAFGRQLNFTYDMFGRMATMQDPAGQSYAYTNTVQDHYASVTYPDGKTRTYLFNETAMLTNNISFDGRLTGIIDENNSRFSSYFYDFTAIASRSTHAGGVDNHVINNGSWPASVAVTDPRGTIRTYGYALVNGAHRNTTIAQPAVSGVGTATSAKTYDANGNVATFRDFNNNRTNYAYDLARNLETSRTEALTSAGAATAQTRTITTQWHATFRLQTAVAEPLKITTNAYDPDGTLCGARGALCSRSIQATTDANGSLAFTATPVGTARAWTYTYNANGSVLTVNGPRTDVTDVTAYTYYANNDADFGKRGNLATVTNAAGHATSITAYNLHGQPLTIVDASGLATTLVYDQRQRLTSRTAGTEVTGYTYDAAGQLTKVTLPDTSFLSYTYDAAHQLTGIEDNLGNRIAYTVDLMGNRTQEQVFDPASMLTQTRSRVFNNLNRLFQELGAQSQTTQYAYDNQGNVASIDGPLAGATDTTTSAYDALNRLRQVTDPGLGVTQYAYNGLDALSSVTDPRNLVTGYTVDGLGNLTLQQSPDTGNTTNTFDAAGNLLTQTDAKSQVTTHAYDVLNRVTSITFHDSSKQTYSYDQGTNGIGRLSSITETNPALVVTSMIAYAYDPHGRVASETRTVAGVAYALAYAYDGSGRLSGLTYPGGRTVTYGFDGLGRVSQVSTAKAGLTVPVVSSVAYHPFGGVKSYALGNGQTYARSIDLDGRIASYTLGGAGYGIAFDLASRISGITETATPTNVNTYGYDTLDRLTSATTSVTPFTYSYDTVGNRLSKGIGAATGTYAYSSTSNRLSTITIDFGVRSFVFDANGSTTADGNNTYAYDVRGRMAQATSALGPTDYQVNALGQRIRKTNSLGDRVFHYDTRGRLFAETDSGGALKRELIYLGDIPVAVIQ